jgi:hypothetical protein
LDSTIVVIAAIAAGSWIPSIVAFVSSKNSANQNLSSLVQKYNNLGDQIRIKKAVLDQSDDTTKPKVS